MKLDTIETLELKLNPHQIWLNQWFLLTSGDYHQNDYNTMTVAWGSIGTMWNKPFVQVVVRPTRYTFKFTEKYESFSLCAFPDKYKDALRLLGSKSGKDGDKIGESRLTPVASKKITAPCFEEADLVIECLKIYWDDLKPNQFLNSAIEKCYPAKDYHRVYFGEIVHISGDSKYCSRPGNQI